MKAKNEVINTILEDLYLVQENLENMETYSEELESSIELWKMKCNMLEIYHKALYEHYEKFPDFLQLLKKYLNYTQQEVFGWITSPKF